MTVWIAAAALVVSFALPLFLDSRQKPRVRVRISTLLVISDKDELRYYMVSAINHGRSAVTINRMDLIYWTKAQKIDIHLGLPQQTFPRGPNLPKELNPYSNISFGVLQDDVHQRIGKLDGVRRSTACLDPYGRRSSVRRGTSSACIALFCRRHRRRRARRE